MAVQLSNKIRIIFFLSQIIYMAFGAVMFAVGIYSIVNLQRFGDFTGNTYVAGSAIFIFVGMLKFLFGVLGILVMFWQKKPLTMIFVSGVIVLMLLTFAAAIYAFLARPGAFFTSRDRLSDVSENELVDLRNVLDEPYCNRTAENILTISERPCFVFLAREIQQDLYVIGSIGIGFATSELTGLLIAMQNFEGL